MAEERLKPSVQFSANTDLQPKKVKLTYCPVDVAHAKKLLDPTSYFELCFKEARHKAGYDLNSTQMSLSELSETLSYMGFFPNEFQLQIGYEYGCFEEKYASYIMNLSPSKQSIKSKVPKPTTAPIKPDQPTASAVFNPKAYCEWLKNNFRVLSERGREDGEVIKYDSNGIRQRPVSPQQSSMFRSGNSTKKLNKLEQIQADSNARGKEQLDGQMHRLNQIFGKIDKLRKENGQMPLDLSESSSSDEDDSEMTAEDLQMRSKARKKQLVRQIPYDPDMFELNAKIGQLRSEASQEIRAFVDFCKQDPKMLRRLEKGIEKYHKVRVEANERVGKIAAVHAQKRLVNTRKESSPSKEDAFVTAHDTDLLRNIRISHLMEKTDKPHHKYELQIKPGSEYEKRLNKLIRDQATR